MAHACPHTAIGLYRTQGAVSRRESEAGIVSEEYILQQIHALHDKVILIME